LRNATLAVARCKRLYISDLLRMPRNSATCQAAASFVQNSPWEEL
jgi:hypothetical protein